MSRWLRAIAGFVFATSVACGPSCLAVEAAADQPAAEPAEASPGNEPPFSSPPSADSEPTEPGGPAVPPSAAPPAPETGTSPPNPDRLTDEPGSPKPPAADGTTSVVAPAGTAVPQPPTAPISSGFQQPGLPAETATTPSTQNASPSGAVPSDGASPPPTGTAEPLLASVLEPMDGRGAGDPAAPSRYTRPLPLLEALERSGDRARRLWITHAYWKTVHGFAAVRWATEAIERLELIAPGSDPNDRATLDVATAAGRADLADARAQLGVAQQELIDLSRLPASEPLPWPVDRPLAGPYQTHFDAIFTNRVVTGRVRAIARTLPARHDAVEARAAAVRAAENAMAMAEADHAKGKRPIEAVVAAHAAVVAQQREFLQAVKVYNLEIAEYAMAVADLSVPDDRFVSMLIAAPVRWRPPDAAAVVAPDRTALVPSSAPGGGGP